MLKEVPVSFIVISELMIMTVFIVTYILIISLSKKIDGIAARSAQIMQQNDENDE